MSCEYIFTREDFLKQITNKKKHKLAEQLLDGVPFADLVPIYGDTRIKEMQSNIRYAKNYPNKYFNGLKACLTCGIYGK